MNRLSAIDGQILDALIIGGGIAGAGIARDLALRGASVALFDKGDFASGTTSRSSKLIHGGLRYLELWDFGLVRESLTEREILRRLAPHLIRPIPFLVPIYRWSRRGLVKVRVGLKCYQWLAPGKRGERYRVMSAAEALALEPQIRPEDLLGAGYYFDDLLLSPERLCLQNLLSAARHGARIFNYSRVEEVTSRDGGIVTMRVRDLVSDAVHLVEGRVIVNAAGPWVDQIRELAGVQERGRRLIRTTKGIHCLLPRLAEHALYLLAQDGRMIFLIPWHQFTLVGTTDTDFDEDPDAVCAGAEEVSYLLEEVRRVFPDPRVCEANVVYTYAGVRPLTYDSGGSPSSVSRQHKVFAEAQGRFLTITGTKLTCFRSLAEQVGDRVLCTLDRQARSRTANQALDGTERPPELEAQTWFDVSTDIAATGLAPDTLEALLENYGRSYRHVLDLARELPDGANRLCPENPDIVAQLHYAVAEELAVSLADFMLRRTGIGLSACQGLDCAEAIARRMGDLLGWSSARCEAEIESYHDVIERSHRFRHG